VLLFRPQVALGLAWDQTWVSVVRGQLLSSIPLYVFVSLYLSTETDLLDSMSNMIALVSEILWFEKIN